MLLPTAESLLREIFIPLIIPKIREINTSCWRIAPVIVKVFYKNYGGQSFEKGANLVPQTKKQGDKSVGISLITKTLLHIKEEYLPD